MMIPERLHEPLEFAANELKGLLRAEEDGAARLVQKGLMLFRQGLVYQIKFEKNNRIAATVQDVTPAKVELDLDFIHLSECSCPAEDEFCRHKIAVFFQILSKAKSVSTWLEEWRQPIKDKQVAKTWGLQKAKDLLKSSGGLGHDYDRWMETFKESFHELMQSNGEPKPYLIPELFKIYIKRLNAGAPLEREWKLLYQLVGTIYSFRLLMEFSVRLGFDKETINRYYLHLFQSLMDDAIEIMDQLSVHSLPFAFDAFIERLKDDSYELIAADFSLPFERTHMYRLLWTHFFMKKEWREAEHEKLRALFDTDHGHHDSLVVGIIHLHILLRKDTEALALLSAPDTDMAPYMLYWLDLLTAHKDWNRIGPFIEAFIPKLKGYLRDLNDHYSSMDFTHYAIQAVSGYCNEANRFDLLEKTLIETLPYSFNDYEYILFDHKHFDRWADLQALIGIDLDMLPNDRVKEIGLEQPAILLPLYHHAIQNHIAMKNRDQYRAAVRKMKKLRTLYKKLKRQDDWELFLEELLVKTKRLRAFHEECKRGKLIHA